MAPGQLRSLSACLTAAVLCGLIGAVPAAAEPNDTMATAQGPVTGSVTAAIQTENDVDWYFMYALGSTQLDVALTGLGSELDCSYWTVELKDPDGRDLSSTTAGSNEVDHIRYTLPTPGTYYLEVYGFFCEYGSYRLDLTASPGLLTSPPYVPPPASSATTPTKPVRSGSSSGPSASCRHARQRTSALSRALRRARRASDRRRIRRNLRTARNHVRDYCP